MELQHLRNIANKLNFSYHHMLGAEKLEQRLRDYCKNNSISFEDISDEVLNEYKKEDKGEVLIMIKDKKIDLSKATFDELEKSHNKEVSDKRTKDALKLVRCMITCNNKNKTSYKGEIFAARNAVINEVKKFIPFGRPTHVPQILLNVIKEKQYQTFVEETLPNGTKVNKPHLINEYNIQILDPISKDELEAIKRKQLAEGFNGE